MAEAFNNATDLLDALAKELLKKVKSGDASAQELNVARQFLKDNKIECIPTKENSIGQLEESMLDDFNKEFSDGLTH